MKAVFARGKEISDKQSPLPLSINNCGYYRDVDLPLDISRSRGRSDYHLVLAATGEIVTEHGKIRAGEGVVFRPYERQVYAYRPFVGSLYFWIHFSGTDAESLFSPRTGDGILRYTAFAPQVHELFHRIVAATSEGQPYAERYACGLFRAVAALIDAQADKRSPFSKTLAMMRDFSVSHTVADYAAASGMSEGHFIRAFKASLGKSPAAYRSDLQIEQAKELLIGTSLKISTVAGLSGFSDALYFSRVFREKTGLSPSEFRKSAFFGFDDTFFGLDKKGGV